ncbi:MAG: ABC transporter ATP-binding protein [Deltaproteobacteria bacterium]|nr:ABC transporter ATP-binding protein [Deltaproteobacteria bacterium]
MTVRVSVNPLLRALSWRSLRGPAQELAPFLRPVRRDMWLALACSIGTVLMVIARPWPIKMVFDYALLPAERIKWVFPFALMKGYGATGVTTISCVLLLAVSLLWGLFSYLQRFLVAGAGQQVAFSLRRHLFQHLQRLALSFHRRQRIGDLVLRATSDTNMMREMMVEAVIVFFTQFLVLVAMVAVMAAIDWQLTAISLSVLPILSLTIFHISTDLRSAVRKQRRREGRMASHLGETLQAIAVVQAHGRERYELARFSDANKQNLRQGLKTVRLEASLERSSEVMIAIGTGLVLWFGTQRVLAGILSPGDLLVFTSYLASMYKPLRKIAQVSTRVSKARVSAERVFAILRVDERVRVPRDAPDAPPFAGRVAFRNVSFGYQPRVAALDDVSLTIKPGQTLAIVGPNGAGKSTLCALLPRLFDPSSGTITVDGHKIGRFKLESLRDQIGVVLQQPVLFATTIRENIAYGKPDATDDEIVAAAMLADAHEFITRLPAGYDTGVGERGETLSGGQRQKIAIARAMVKNPPILILDEPTAHLDASSAANLDETLRRVSKNKTTIRVAHRLSEIRKARRIVVLEQGRVAQYGSHAELVAQPGWYRETWRLQGGQLPAVQELGAGEETGGAAAMTTPPLAAGNRGSA